MSRFRRLGHIIAAGTITATTAAVIPAVASAEDLVTFSVTNITDFHGHLLPGKEMAEGKEMGAARLQSLVKHVNENQEYVLTSSGDNVGGSAFISAIDQDNPTMEALNAMGLDVSAVGNHEFDQGVDDLTGRITNKSDFPILGANVYKDGERILPATYVQEVEGVKVGFVGTVTQLTKSKVAPDKIEGIEITDPVEETNKEAKRLKESNEADVVVALMHEDALEYKDGFDDSVDVIFGGDSHQKTDGRIQREGQPDILWAQGYEYGKLLNDVDLTYDRQAGKLTNSELKQYSAADAAALDPDPNIDEIVKKAQKVADEKGKQVVGKLDNPLVRGSAPGKAPGTNRGTESTGNNFIAEANRAILSEETGQDVQIGIMNAGGVREDLEAGEVTYEQAATVQPFNNDISVGKLTGADLIQLLEQQWKAGGDRARLALGLSEGFTYSYDPSAPQGERVLAASLNGEPIVADQQYTVAASSFLFSGGDGFDAFKNAKDVVNVGANDLQVYAKYLAREDKKYPFAQRDAGVHIDGELKPGNTVTVKLSGLNYTSEGEPQAKNVTVKLGDATATADINNAAGDGDDQGNEHGRAEVQLEVPQGIDADSVLEITTDVQGGDEAPIRIPVGKLSGDLSDDDQSGQQGGNGSGLPGLSSDGLSSNGSAVLGAAGGSAALAAIAAPMIGNAAQPWADQVRQAFGF